MYGRKIIFYFYENVVRIYLENFFFLLLFSFFFRILKRIEKKKKEFVCRDNIFDEVVTQ